ncbi:hypothetical protein C066_02057 [Brucella sp. UK5/01]|uniref:Response regulator n=1 Tax=Brucella pinnipedialis M292/94/1 TaxID=520462 RepID=A0A0E1X220_9HYPH|nr:response regulator [Brucella pinnipedialis M292/94/1]ENR13758.1 hypothetical protein C066_02057 [Brucella sp. UK5/01]ENT25024.1 hypothetical protein C051_00076 [Brucella sp. UK40/99]
MNDLEHRRILVVEDEVFVALDVAATVEDANGTVVGPVGTVRQAIDLINRQEVDAAIRTSISQTEMWNRCWTG